VEETKFSTKLCQSLPQKMLEKQCFLQLQKKLQKILKMSKFNKSKILQSLKMASIVLKTSFLTKKNSAKTLPKTPQNA
jgi:hypothetical protein